MHFSSWGYGCINENGSPNVKKKVEKEKKKEEKKKKNKFLKFFPSQILELDEH